MNGKLVCGVGINDVKSSSNTVVYRQWTDMIRRCYSSGLHINQPTYSGCSVVEDWHNLSKFKFWVDSQIKEPGWQLDKDLLFPGNKVYGPETCLFVPQWINSLVTNHNAARGKYPIGVTFNKVVKKYQAQLRIDGVQCALGYYGTPEEAHMVWLNSKLDYVRNKKEILDLIDKRLYPNIVDIIRKTL